MSKIIYACLRRRTDDKIAELKRWVAFGASRIAPAGINLRPTRVFSEGAIVVGVLNPATTILAQSGSVCVGHVEADIRWNEVGGVRPEGTYGICRSNGRTIELLSDTVGSRTLWYFMDDTIFVASTSQRWIAIVLGTFEPNPRTLGWMLTCGNLGPTEAWDRRVTRLQADSTLTLNVDSWTTALRNHAAEFRPVNGNISNIKSIFRHQLQSAFRQLEFDFSKWVLPLSGGYDSRAILCMLPRKEGLRAITWGTRESTYSSVSDAAVASKLARSVGVAHEYFELDSSAGTLSAVFDKFVAYGEGRVDHISGYLDGFAIWQALLNRGIEGIIRGDEGFGWRDVKSHAEARRSVGLMLWSDFGNLKSLEPEFQPQVLPKFLCQQVDETSSQWRDRLYHLYRIPTILSALTDLKASFVEIANPLLTHSIIAIVRSLPDDLRTDKRLFKSIVDELTPDIPYAKTESIADARSILRSGEAVELLSEVLISTTARSMFPETVLTFVLENMNRRPHPVQKRVSLQLKRKLRTVAPRYIKGALRRTRLAPAMDINVMAFRIYIACRSNELLHADAHARHIGSTH